jgi:hypothetical protein
MGLTIIVGLYFVILCVNFAVCKFCRTLVAVVFLGGGETFIDCKLLF